MYYINKFIVHGKQARVKNADLRHPSCTVKTQICVTRPQCVKNFSHHRFDNKRVIMMAVEEASKILVQLRRIPI